MSTGPTAPQRPEEIRVDGKRAASVDVLDRGLQYGDGLFETLTARAGVVRFLALHLERLSEGCLRLGIEGVDFGVLRAELVELARARERCTLKLIVTRGSATRRGYGPSGTEKPRRVVMRYADIGPTDAVDALQVGFSSVPAAENPLLARLKHLNRLDNVLARREAERLGLDEALMLAGSGTLVSGTMSNVFMVRDGELLTPSLERCGVAGVMRAVVLREARGIGCLPREGVFGRDDVALAEELFMTNVRWGVRPVCRMPGRELRAGPVASALRTRIEALDA